MTIHLVRSPFLLHLFVDSKLAADIPVNFESRAYEVMQHIQQTFYVRRTGLYSLQPPTGSPHSCGEMASCFQRWWVPVDTSQKYRPVMDRFFKSMDVYWDSKDHPPGYGPAPTQGDGHDKYYDDNEWMVLAFAEAYQLTGDRQYLPRAESALQFALSGWDNKLGGGIWWHETHKGRRSWTFADHARY